VRCVKNMDLGLFRAGMNTEMAAVRTSSQMLLNINRFRNPNFLTGKHIAVYGSLKFKCTVL